jgi:hypothetical protein
MKVVGLRAGYSAAVAGAMAFWPDPAGRIRHGGYVI